MTHARGMVRKPARLAFANSARSQFRPYFTVRRRRAPASKSLCFTGQPAPLPNYARARIAAETPRRPLRNLHARLRGMLRLSVARRPAQPIISLYFIGPLLRPRPDIPPPKPRLHI
jgi:hypothetical protein